MKEILYINSLNHFLFKKKYLINYIILELKNYYNI